LLEISCHFTRVNLRRVTAASYLPEFKIGSQQNVNAQEGAEVAGEAMEMPELRRGKPLVQWWSSATQFMNELNIFNLFFCFHKQTMANKTKIQRNACFIGSKRCSLR